MCGEVMDDSDRCVVEGVSDRKQYMLMIQWCGYLSSSVN